MRILRHLQYWLTGGGPHIRVADFVPETHPVRQWADTFPWAALVAAVDRSVAQRFPTPTARGRAPVATRVLLALELLKHELHCSDEQICSQLRTDLAVMYACGIAGGPGRALPRAFRAPRGVGPVPQPPRRGLDGRTAGAPGRRGHGRGPGEPGALVVDTFPSEQGSQRVNDAATLYKAKKKSSRSSRTSPSTARPRARR